MPPIDHPGPPPVWRRLLQVSLATLLLVALWLGSLGTLYYRWSPWKVQSVVRVPDEQLRLAAYSPNGKYVAISNNSDGVYLFDDMTGQKMAFLYDGWKPPYPKEVIALPIFSPDSSKLVIESEGTFSVWEVGSGKKVIDLKRLGNPAMQDRERVIYSHDGTRMVMLDDHGCVYIVNAADGAQIRRWTPVKGAGVSAAYLSPDDNTLITTAYDDNVRVWDVETGAHKFDLQSPALGTAEFSPGGEEIITTALTSKDVDATGLTNVKRRWSSKTGEKISESHDVNQSVPPPSGDITGYSADHRFCLNTARHYNGTQVWDMQRGREVTMLFGPEGYGSYAVFSPNSERILVVAVRGDSFRYWVRQRPDSAFGVAVLPEFWISIIIAGMLAVILWRRLRKLRSERH